MSSIEDRAKEILKEEIDQLIELQDQGIRLTEKKTEVIENMVRKLEASGMNPDKICATIKRILKQNYIEISDWTVEKACGIDKKRKYDRYQSPIKSEETSDFQQPVTVASDGSESKEPKPEFYEGDPEPVPSMREVSEQAAEIALSLADQYAAGSKELETRLNEALRLADDKDKRIDELLLQIGELELQVGDLKKNPPKDVDKREELQIENDNMKQTILELQEALRANIKASGFIQSSQLPKQVWLAAINAINFYRELNKASRYAIEHNDPWKKIVFAVDTDGQLKAAKLES